VNGFAGVVNLNDTVPSGLICGTITPTSVTGAGTATVSCSASIAGNYTLTLNGTSGSLAHSASALFQFRDFTISAPSPPTVNAGNPANSTITVVAVNHFAGQVSLTDTIPSGLSCGTITPNIVTGSGIAILSCSSNVAGNYTVTVTGTNGALSHTATLIVSVQDYTITANPTSVKINAGSPGSSNITVTPLNHFTGTVSLSPSTTNGLTPAINPTSLNGGSGTATLSFSSTMVGNYTVTVTSSSGTITHATTVIVQVVDFALNTNATTITTLAGATAGSTVIIMGLNGFSGTVNLIPSPSMGLAATILPTSISGSGSSTMLVSTSTSGNYSVTIKATSGQLSHLIGVVVHVLDYSLAGNPATLSAPIGSSTSSTLTLKSLNGYAGNINVTYTVQAVSGTSSSNSGGGGSRGFIMAPPTVLPIVIINPQSFQLSSSGTQQSAVSISLPSNLASGNYLITVTASDGTLSHQIVLTVAATDFSITATPTSVSLRPGSNTTVVLNLQSMNFFQGNVSLTVTSPAGGPTGTLNTSTVSLTFYSNVNLNLTIQVPAGTALGNYTITVQATSGTVSHTLNILVRVTATGFVTILAGIFSPHNATPISALAIFTLLTILLPLKVRNDRDQKLRLHRRRNIENRVFHGSAASRSFPYPSSIPPLWSHASRDEF
jgi:hypothetical protein